MTASNGVLEWRVGDVHVTRIVEMEMAAAYNPDAPFLMEATPKTLRTIPWLYPHFVTEKDELKLSIHALLVEAPGLKLIVDTCIGNDKPRSMLGGAPLQTAFLQSLEAAGCKREDIDTVICTHLHVDHVGWNTMLEGGKWVPTFPNARYLIGKQEYAHWKNDSDAETRTILGDSVQPIFDHGLVDLVEMDHRLSPEIHLMPTPGHTPGHVSVVIESKGQRAIITGDMLHHPCQFAHPEWSPPFDTDPVAGASMRRSVMEKVADKPTLVIGTHFASPTAGHVKRDGGAFRFDVG
jgi:glyoxylase-like metal-dependent hydrolase (beta-lactamase superfamily II)